MSHAPRLFKGIALVALLTLSSCSFYKDVVNELEGSTSSGDDYAATDSLNRYIDLLNTAHDNMDYFEDSLISLESDMSYYDSSYGLYFYCSFDYDAYDTTLEYDVTNPSGLTDEESSSLVSQSQEIYEQLEAGDALCTEMTKHITAEDYKADDFAWLTTKIEEGYAVVDAYYDLHNAMLDEVEGYFDNYSTWEVDPSDPVSVGIDNMDKDISAAEDILDMIEENYMGDTTAGVADQLQPLYDALMTSTTEHMSYDVGSDMSYYYSTFYDELDQNFLPTVKRAIRNFEAGDLDSISWDYSDVLDSYNYLVDDYNYYLDYSGY